MFISRLHRRVGSYLNQANIVSFSVSGVDAAYDKSCFHGLLPSSILG